MCTLTNGDAEGLQTSLACLENSLAGIRVIFTSQFAVSMLDLILCSITFGAHNLVVIFK